VTETLAALAPEGHPAALEVHYAVSKAIAVQAPAILSWAQPVGIFSLLA